MWTLDAVRSRGERAWVHGTQEEKTVFGISSEGTGSRMTQLYKSHLCIVCTWDRPIYGSSLMYGTGSVSLETGKADFSQAWSLEAANLRPYYSLFGRRCVGAKAFVSLVPALMCLVLLLQSQCLPFLTLVLTLVPSRRVSFIFHQSL